MRRAVVFFGVIGTLVGIAIFLRFAATTPVSHTPAKEEGLTLELAAARIQPMPVVLQSVGQVTSEHMVQIRPQVSGMLKQVLFKEGQFVSKGQRLFEIESVPEK